MSPTTSDDDLNDESNPEFVLPDDITSLLTNEATWEPVSPDLESSIVDAILAEVDENASPNIDDAASANVVAISDKRPPARWKTAAMGAAAALVLVAALFGVTQLASGDSADFEIALAGTDLVPAAAATAEITDTPEGTRIVISVSDLPPAAPGTYYQAWLRKDAEIGVSAGTFHLRSGDGPIELWAGVSTDDYPLLTVTVQQEAQTESSGQVVLKALIG